MYNTKLLNCFIFVLSLLYHLEVLSEQDLLPQQTASFSTISSLTQSGEIFFPEKNSISQINQAEEFFNLGLYEDALPHYIGALENGNDNQYLKLRIAQIYLLFRKHTEALAVLNLLDNLSYEIENLVLIMRAHAERSLGNHKVSIDILKPFSLAEGVNTTSKMPYFEQAQLELALNYLALGDEISATKHLISIPNQKKQAELFCFAQLQLAQIAFKKDALNEVEKILSPINDLLTPNTPLSQEINLLKAETSYQRHDYAKAVTSFNLSIPASNLIKDPSIAEALYKKGWCYLKLAETADTKNIDKDEFYKNSQEAFEKSSQILPQEKTTLALAQSLISQGSLLNDTKAFERAKELLNRENIFQTSESKGHAIFLLAEASQTFAEKKDFYKQFTQQENRNSPYYAKGFYLQGYNDLTEARKLLAAGLTDDGKALLKEAVPLFEQAFEHLTHANDKRLAALALKLQAEAYLQQDSNEADEKALSSLKRLIEENDPLAKELADPLEAYSLYSQIAYRLGSENSQKELFTVAKTNLEKGLNAHPSINSTDTTLKLLGSLYYKEKNYVKAKESFEKILASFPHSQQTAEALYWISNCKEFLEEDRSSVQNLRKELFEKYPESPLAAEAYFRYFSYNEYLEGKKEAVRHLEKMVDYFPDSPFLINANYLIGMDFKRDRKSPEGKWLRRQNLTAAIDSFQKAENIFDALKAKNTLPNDKIDHFTAIRYRSTLERALTNLAIAEESQGAKQQIYLEYAENVLQKIVMEFFSKNNSTEQLLTQNDPLTSIKEESAYWLSQTYIKSHDDKKAEYILQQMLHSYQTAKVTNGYYLSKALYSLGSLAVKKEEPQRALKYFCQAEEAAKGRVLSVDDVLDIRICKALVFKQIGNLDRAMLILSNVINEDAISSQRLRAMLLRAEIYELQGRYELARKQLEATSKKGGPWAQQAKEKLEKNYGCSI